MMVLGGWSFFKSVIRKEAWFFYKTVPVSAYVGSSKNLKDLKARYPRSRREPVLSHTQTRHLSGADTVGILA